MKVSNCLAGTAETKRLISNITRDLQREAPYKKHVDYTIASLANNGRIALFTDDENGNLRNASIILMKGFKALVSNETGDITIQKKPFFISSKKYFDKILNFLKQVQPDNFRKNEIECSLKLANADVYKVVSKANIDDIKYQKITEGSNNCEFPEVF